MSSNLVELNVVQPLPHGSMSESRPFSSSNELLLGPSYLLRMIENSWIADHSSFLFIFPSATSPRAFPSPPLPPPQAQRRSRGDPPGQQVKLSDGYSCWNWCGYICCFGCFVSSSFLLRSFLPSPRPPFPRRSLVFRADQEGGTSRLINPPRSLQADQCYRFDRWSN